MKIIFTALFLICAQYALSQNIHSAYIHQKTIGNVIEVDYFVTASVADSNLTASIIDTKITCSSTKESVDLTGLFLVNQTRSGNQCNPKDKPWIYVFHKTINLNDTAYASISGCCDFRLDAQIDHRDTNVNTLSGAKGQKIYVYTDLLHCGGLKNYSSVLLDGFGQIQTCGNTATYLNLMANEVAEYDSITYSLVTPQSNNKTNLAFDSLLFRERPLTVYNPRGQAPSYSFPTSIPPIGFYFSENTGDMIFTPIDSKQVGAITLRIAEWRKYEDTYYKIGETQAEIGIEITTCPGNNPPSISGSFPTTVCAGEEICFYINTNDIVKVPPPPATTPKQDTVSLKWNKGIPSATFTIVNPHALHQTGRFCWTPKITDSVYVLHKFVVTARDNFCPTNATTSRVISLYLKPTLKGDVLISRVSDSTFTTTYISIDGFVKPHDISVQLVDSSGYPVADSSIGHFTSSGTNRSRKFEDVLVLKAHGEFYLNSTVVGEGCPIWLVDTLSQYSLGVPYSHKNQLNLFPNPSQDIVHLPFTLEHVQLISISGKIVLDIYNTKMLNVKHLPTGIYFFIGEKDGIQYCAKLMKE